MVFVQNFNCILVSVAVVFDTKTTAFYVMDHYLGRFAREQFPKFYQINQKKFQPFFDMADVISFIEHHIYLRHRVKVFEMEIFPESFSFEV